MSKNKDNFTNLLAVMENDAAKLAVIAGIITTLGDVLATIAALEEARHSNNSELFECLTPYASLFTLLL